MIIKLNRETKRQIFALFILFMFVGSALAFALLSAFTPEEEKKVQLMYDRLLSNSEEAEFLQQNMVVIKFFYSEDCENCEEINNIINQVFQDLKGKMIIEKVDIYYYQEEAEILEVDSAPYLYLKGKTIDRVSGETTLEELTKKLCDLYFEPIDECFLVE